MTYIEIVNMIWHCTAAACVLMGAWWAVRRER